MSLFKKKDDSKFAVGIGFGEYKYNYTYVPPLAYADSIHLQDLPHLKWIFKVGKEALKILANQVLVDLDQKLEETKAEIRQQIREEDISGLIKQIDKQHRHLFHFMEGGIHSLIKEFKFDEVDDARSWFREVIKAITSHAEKPDRNLEQYKDLFKILKIPTISKHLHNNELFGYLRVAGYNPLVIQRAEHLPDNFDLSEEKFNEAPGFEDDSIEAALADGRLYLADYKELEVLLPGQIPAPKNVYRPIALFGIPQGGEILAPIAVQMDQLPQSGSVIGPRDGDSWNKAMTCVESSDSNYHELISHLGRTHLLVEPFVVATHRNLSKRHPIRQLLMPHFEGTIFINGLAVDTLVNDGGPVDQLLQGTIESDLKLTANGLLAVGFDASCLPVWLEDRGLDDVDKLPYYPYRDDGLMIWDAISIWAAGYVSVYYESDEDVQDDDDLQAWAADLISDTGGRVKDFGEGDGIETREYLANVLTMLIFTASAAHAAVNFPQSSLMSYTPSVPLAGYKPAPNLETPDAYEWIDMLPDIKMAEEQIQVLYLLGSVYYTRLGDYGDDYFDNPSVQALSRNFSQRLDEIESVIAERNLTRPISYPYLLPSLIPQSINI